jgi:SAM-dependent methyltransferase
VTGRAETANRPARSRSEDRERWLSLLEELFDPATLDRLERLGVRPGWHVLDVGAGRGSIATWVARRVRPGGHVIATDVDTRFLERISEPDLEVLRHDVLADDFPPESFDLVHCRALLVHLAERQTAVERMVRWLKPGGVLLAEEPWLDVGLLSPDPVAVRAARALKQTMDGGFARRLPLALRHAGLERVDAEGRLVFFEGGTKLASFYRHALEGACVPLVAAGRMDRADVQQMISRYEDPNWSDCGWPRVAAWGWKPA